MAYNVEDLRRLRCLQTYNSEELKRLRNLVDALREHDSDCATTHGRPCDCGAEDFRDSKWDVPL